MKVSKRPKIRNTQKKSSIAMCQGLLRASDKRSKSASSSDSSNYASSFDSLRGSSSIGSYSDASAWLKDSSTMCHLTKENVTSKALIGQAGTRKTYVDAMKHTREEKFALKPLEKRHKYSDTKRSIAKRKLPPGNPKTWKGSQLRKDFQDPTSLSLDKLELVDSS
ncbi:hypothetical protein Tco_0700168 [Tanacetum coccineum]